MALLWQNMNGIQVMVPDKEPGVIFTSRAGGVSTGPYRSLNLGRFTNDSPEAVGRNRDLVSAAAGIPTRWLWARQVHGSNVATGLSQDVPDADALATGEAGLPLAVFTADCLPIAMKGKTGIAAVHAGWRGLASGVIDRAVEALRAIERGPVRAWIGPSIGPCHYGVGPEVADALTGRYPDAPGLSPAEGDRFRLDMRSSARWILCNAGVETHAWDPPCTYCDERFFSHRRDKPTGRQAVVVWKAR